MHDAAFDKIRIILGTGRRRVTPRTGRTSYAVTSDPPHPLNPPAFTGTDPNALQYNLYQILSGTASAWHQHSYMTEFNVADAITQ